jgi:hypothetical protein
MAMLKMLSVQQVGTCAIRNEDTYKECYSDKSMRAPELTGEKDGLARHSQGRENQSHK